VTLVPVNTAFRVEEARYPVEHAGARVLVTGAAGFEVAREVYQRAAGLRELVVVGRGARIQATGEWHKASYEICGYGPRPASVLFSRYSGDVADAVSAMAQTGYAPRPDQSRIMKWQSLGGAPPSPRSGRMSWGQAEKAT
jgi:hypothetical protein